MGSRDPARETSVEFRCVDFDLYTRGLGLPQKKPPTARHCDMRLAAFAHGQWAESLQYGGKMRYKTEALSAVDSRLHPLSMQAATQPLPEEYRNGLSLGVPHFELQLTLVFGTGSYP